MGAILRNNINERRKGDYTTAGVKSDRGEGEELRDLISGEECDEISYKTQEDKKRERGGKGRKKKEKVEISSAKRKATVVRRAKCRRGTTKKESGQRWCWRTREEGGRGAGTIPGTWKGNTDIETRRLNVEVSNSMGWGGRPLQRFQEKGHRKDVDGQRRMRERHRQVTAIT